MRHWYTRYQLSNALDRGTLPAALARGHAARCASCQRFARDLQALHTRLVDGATAARAPVRARAHGPRWWLAAAPLALGAAAVVAVSLGSPATPPPLPPFVIATPPSTAPTPGVRELAARVSSLLASHTPLDSELDNLIHDGRRGLDTVLATGGLRRAE